MTRRRGAALIVVLVAVAVVLALALLLRGNDGDPSSAARDVCRDPELTTSENRTWRDGGFVVDQDMWNNATGTQTLRACSYRQWSVTATQPDTPDVKTYPNVHRDFDDPRLDSFAEITSSFGSLGPERGIYDFTYDVWFDGVASDGSTEIMVWTDTRGNAPHVPRRGAFTSRGISYDVYRAGRYIAFLGPDRHAGQVDLLAFFRYAVGRGWLRPGSTIGQIDFGVEIVSTDDEPLDFAVTDFTLTAR